MESAGELFKRGVDLAESGRIDEALEIAAILRGYRYTGAFEVEAVARNEAGDSEGAIAALRRGLRKKRVWRVGHLLGIYLSDAGRYEEALKALGDSVGMYEPEPLMTAYNIAIVLERAGRTDEAIGELEQIIARGPQTDEPDAVNLASKMLSRLRADRRVPPARRRRTLRGR